ncbi:MAG TPA: hypothetical protein VFT50_11465 [Baekduia sp.]|nr:hypothetical protein [Baekduia sp.]
MQHHRRGRSAAAVVAAAGAALALVPATASALNVTLTDDAGTPQAWSGQPAIRNMSPQVGIGFGPSEKGSYSATFAGPDGAGVSSPIDCYGINTSRTLDFRGNGAYTVTIQQFPDKDYTCKTPSGAPQVYTFSINSGVTLGALTAPVLIREPGSYVTQPVVLPFAGNPGALGYEIRYARNGAIGPDGAIQDTSQQTYVDPATGQVPLRLTDPGSYVVVARAKGFSTGTGQFFSPWTPPVTVKALAPFDFSTTRTVDSRGPSYKVKIQLREKSARGRVSVAVARGKKGRKFHSLGSAKINRKGIFKKRFTLHRTGTYRMRFRFKGSATVAPGTAMSTFRVTKHYLF